MEIGYRTLKLLHVFGAVLFIGNLVVTAVWKTLADRTGRPEIVAFSQRLVTVTDLAFTAPGAVLVIVPGVMMAFEFGDAFWEVPWIGWGLALFSASGLIWGAILLPIQMRQAKMSRQFEAGGEIPPAYRRLGRFWMLFGSLATLLPLVALYFMVLRPE